MKLKGQDPDGRVKKWRNPAPVDPNGTGFSSWMKNMLAVAKIKKTNAIRCFLTGMPSSGKTTLLYKLKLGEGIIKIPHTKYSVSRFFFSSFLFFFFF